MLMEQEIFQLKHNPLVGLNWWWRGSISVLLITSTMWLWSPLSVSAQSECAVSQIAILPGPWENSGTKISLTAQVQDSDSILCPADQTIRLLFEGSVSGQFLNQGGTAGPQAWISTNQANRNFYYESSTLATDSVTVRAGYGSAGDWTESWSKTEAIADLLQVSDNEDEADDEEDEDGDNEDNPVSNSSSAHSSPSRLSTVSPIAKLEIEAGRDRLVLTGSQIKFRGEIVKENNLLKQPTFVWALGDGRSAKGVTVEHTYIFPGTYQVILNAKSGVVEAVDRLTVVVVEPELELNFKRTEGVIDIVNKGSHEANIGGWRLVQGDNSFSFPVDTIIAAANLITLNYQIIGWDLSPTLEVGLLNDGAEISPVLKVEFGQEVNQLEAIATLEKAKLQLLALSSGVATSTLLVPVNRFTQELVEPLGNTDNESRETTATRASPRVLVLRPPQNHLANLLSLPKKSLSWLGDLW